MAFKWFGDKVSKWVNEKVIEPRMLAAGEAMVGVAKALVPVDTGLLKSRIYYTYAPDLKLLTLHADTHYAWYVEMGTYKTRPKPFLRPAMNAAKLSFLDGRIGGVTTQIAAGTSTPPGYVPKKIQPRIRPHIAAANRMHNVGRVRKTRFTAIHMERNNESVREDGRVATTNFSQRRLNRIRKAWN